MKSRPRGFGKKQTPTAVASVLASTLAGYRIAEKIQEYAAFPQWESIVGEDIAKVTKPEKILRSRILVVRVLDAAWAQELAMKKPTILDQIFESGVGATIEDIHFISGDPKSIR